MAVLDIFQPLLALFLTLLSPLAALLYNISHPIIDPIYRSIQPFLPPPSVSGFITDFPFTLRVSFFPTLRIISTSVFHTLRPLLTNPFLPLTSPRSFVRLLGAVYQIIRPSNVRSVFFAHLWVTFGAGVDEGSGPYKKELLKDARGVVLEIGAGYGHTIKYLTHSQVTHFVALEPNAIMHPQLRAEGAKYGYTEEKGNLIILGTPAEDIQALRRGLEEGIQPIVTLPDEQDIEKISSASPSRATSPNGLPNGLVPFPLVSPPLTPRPQIQIDTIISVLTMCSIPRQALIPALTNLVTLLAPASPLDPRHTAPVPPPPRAPGLFLFYEHTLNPHSPRTRLWQIMLSPVWRQCFGGCELDKDAIQAVREAGRRVARQSSPRGTSKQDTVWSTEESKVWGKNPEDGENKDSLFYHQVGRFIKVSA